MDDTKIVAGEKSGPKFNLVEFTRETRREISKVTWPTRQEIIMTTVRVVVMAIVTGFFFFVVDYLLGLGVGHLLGMKQ